MIIFSRSLNRVSEKVWEILKYLYEVYKESRDNEKKNIYIKKLFDIYIKGYIRGVVMSLN